MYLRTFLVKIFTVLQLLTPKGTFKITFMLFSNLGVLWRLSVYHSPPESISFRAYTHQALLWLLCTLTMLCTLFTLLSYPTYIYKPVWAHTPPQKMLFEFVDYQQPFLFSYRKFCWAWASKRITSSKYTRLLLNPVKWVLNCFIDLLPNPVPVTYLVNDHQLA